MDNIKKPKYLKAMHTVAIPNHLIWYLDLLLLILLLLLLDILILWWCIKEYLDAKATPILCQARPGEGRFGGTD